MAEGVNKRGKNGGRIVITLECTVPDDDFDNYDPPVNDAVDCLRQDVKSYERGNFGLEEFLDSTYVTDIKVEALK